MTATVKYYNVPLTVEFIFEGKFYPETRETPAEYPEIIIQSIKAEDSDIDLQNILDWESINEIIKLIGL